MAEQLTYSDPITETTIEDWPLGRNKRGPAIFKIVTKKGHGERCERVTSIGPGRWSKPKVTTYARLVRIVTGSNGRLYVAELSSYSEAIAIRQSNLQFEEESIWPKDPRHAELYALLTNSPGPSV